MIVGPANATGPWNAGSRLDLAAFAPGIAGTGTSRTPLALGLGAMLLDQAGYSGPRRLLAVGRDEPARACAKLGAELAGSGAATALLVMGDGSARRTLKAPGYLDPRAEGFDSGVERAVRRGDLAALLELDEGLARDLMVTGRPAWQVLAGAMPAPAPACEVLYCDDPFGVAYLVAHLRPREGKRDGRWDGLLGVFHRAAQLRGAAPGLDHPAFRLLFEPPGPVERGDPASLPPLFRLL